MILNLKPLTKHAFAPFGDVISLQDAKDSPDAPQTANQATAQRYNYVARIINARNEKAKPNLCLFHSVPPKALTFPASFQTKLNMQNGPLHSLEMPLLEPFQVQLLERHPHSSQMFVPLQCSSFGYIVIVALDTSFNGNHSDGNTVHNPPNPHFLQAFWATSKQAINYHPNVWHHPIITLGVPAQFVCLVWESVSAGLSSNLKEDTEEFYFNTPITLKVGNELAKL